MDAIETAIRNALEKGDADNRAFRETVYRKAFAALDRALQANPDLTVETAILRRRVLQQKITEIEEEFIPAVAVPAPQPDPPQPDPPRPEPRDPLAGSFAVRLEPGPASDLERPAPSGEDPEPAYDMPDLGQLDMRGESRAPREPAAAEREIAAVASDPDARRLRRRRRPYAYVFIAATLAAAVGMGLWFAWQTGLFLSPAERDTSVPNPPSGDSEDFIPEAEDPPVLSSEPDSQRDWIGIFSPDAADAVSAPADTTAEAMQDESGTFLRIRSSNAGSAVIFDVGQGVLERIAGRKATFNIIARAAEGQNTEMAIDCNFAELGDCGRKRYAVGYERADFLFELTLPAAQPGAGGTIAINSDFAGGGKAVDIYGIRVALSP